MSVRKAAKGLLRIPPLYALLAFLLAKRVVIRGRSMYPTLAPGEFVLFDRLAYRLEPPRRGDVVLASLPGRSQTPMVKRAVGLPGDKVAFAGNHCWINGVPFGGGPVPADPPPEAVILKDEEYLLLGDAPEASTDARHFGPVSRREIQARAWLVYWPLKRFRVVHP